MVMEENHLYRDIPVDIFLRRMIGNTCLEQISGNVEFVIRLLVVQMPFQQSEDLEARRHALNLV